MFRKALCGLLLRYRPVRHGSDAEDSGERKIFLQYSDLATKKTA